MDASRSRRQSVAHPWESLAHDLRAAVRSIRKRPGTAAVAVAAVAVGIAASVTIYSAGRALVTEAVPFPGADRLVTVELRGERGSRFTPSVRDVRVWESEAGALLTLGGYTFENRFVGDDAGTWNVPGSRLTPAFFDVLAPELQLGRTFSSADAAPGSPLVAVLAHRLWQSRFGADPGIIGRSIRIDGRVHTVIGVVRAGLQFPAGADLWTPLVPGEPTAALRVDVVARLDADITAERAQAALAAIQRGLDRERPIAERASAVAVVPFTGRPGDEAMIALLVLQLAVLVLLLIAATNAAGLMLTRALQRRRELAIRASLGASRGRIVRQLFAESALVALTAGIVGTLLARASIEALRNALPLSYTRNILGWDRLALDGHGFAFALVLTAAIAMVFGIVPALRAARRDPIADLREGAAGMTDGTRGRRLSRMLLAGEVALALTLLLVAGLLARSLAVMLGADPGFDADGVLAVEWALPPDEYDEQESLVRFQAPLLERLQSMPGVRSAGIVSNLPMSRTGWGRSYRVEGSDPTSDPRSASWRPVSPEYLATLRIPVLAGRSFGPADVAGAPRVAIVSEALANRHWPAGTDPLGRTLEVEGETWTIVAVAADIHDFGVQQPVNPTIYVPQAQAPTSAGFLAIRVDGDPVAFAPLVRQAIQDIDRGIAVGDVRTLARMVDDFHADERLMPLLMAAFGGIALLITVVSLYVLVAHAVARRRREIGIRLALGADPRRILVGAVSQAFLWVGIGIVMGMALSAAAAQGLASMLYGIGPLDPVVFVLVPGALVAIALLASYIPARATVDVDPVETLRGG